MINLAGLRTHLQPFYNATGRPSIDPELIIRMLIVGYCLGIRSERRLCEKVHLNLAYRWLCRLGLKGDVPDHSTISKNRHERFRDSDLLRELFETNVRRCIEEGLVGGEGCTVDASLIRADANRQRSAAAPETLDGHDLARTRRSVGEYLEAGRGRLRRGQEGHAEVRVPLRPGSTVDRSSEGASLLRLRDQLPLDLDYAVIVDIEATRAIRQAEVGSARTMIDRTQERLGFSPARPAADNAYGSANNLAWLVHERGIESHVAVIDKAERTDGTLSQSDFAYDCKRDLYTCPAVKQPQRYRHRFGVTRDGVDPNGFMRY